MFFDELRAGFIDVLLKNDAYCMSLMGDKLNPITAHGILKPSCECIYYEVGEIIKDDGGLVSLPYEEAKNIFNKSVTPVYFCYKQKGVWMVSARKLPRK
jgi:hypothetical protein